MVITQFNLYTSICFYKYAHNSLPRGSPDMIFNAFDVKFLVKNDGMRPRPCRPLNKMPSKSKKNDNASRNESRPSARAGDPGGAAPWDAEVWGRSPKGAASPGGAAPRDVGGPGAAPPGNNIYIYIYIAKYNFIYNYTHNTRSAGQLLEASYAANLACHDNLPRAAPSP